VQFHRYPGPDTDPNAHADSYAYSNPGSYPDTHPDADGYDQHHRELGDLRHLDN
jgi:hypothetical protein